MPKITRRTLLQNTALVSAIGVVTANTNAGELTYDNPLSHASKNPQHNAADETYWNKLGNYYDKTEGIINLEHGYWGKMASPVVEEYERLTQMVNKQLSYYARKQWYEDFSHANTVVAQALGVASEEMALTRNATESLHGIIGQYKNLKPGDAILYADIDYPAFKRAMQWLADSRGATAIVLSIPAQASQSQLIEIYQSAFKQHPNLKLALLTHVSNQHGLMLPVKEIIDQAKQRDIDVICDCAQSWGLVDFTLPELNADWALFNLHKWIGSPVGVGALYMKKGTLDKVAPFPGEEDETNTKVAKRVHMATSNFAAFLAVPKALEFHHQVGGANKQARLTHLRNIWVEAVKGNPGVEILGATDAQSTTGMAGFRLTGQTSVADNERLQKRLENEFGLFTVVRKGLAHGANIRVTPQVYTSSQDMLALANALNTLTKHVA